MEIHKDSYNELFSKFLNWNPSLLEYLKSKGEADCSKVYYAFIKYFDKNSEERLVAQSSYLYIKSDSEWIDPG